MLKSSYSRSMELISFWKVVFNLIVQKRIDYLITITNFIIKQLMIDIQLGFTNCYFHNLLEDLSSRKNEISALIYLFYQRKPVYLHVLHLLAKIHQWTVRILEFTDIFCIKIILSKKSMKSTEEIFSNSFFSSFYNLKNLNFLK